MSVIARGGYATAESRTAVVATSAADYRRLWSQWIGSGENAPPSVDLENGSVVFLLAGTRNSGGWSIEPQAVSVNADGVAEIVAPVKGPGAGAIVTQALTSPYAVLLIRERGVKSVRWAE